MSVSEIGGGVLRLESTVAWLLKVVTGHGDAVAALELNADASRLRGHMTGVGGSRTGGRTLRRTVPAKDPHGWRHIESTRRFQLHDQPAFLCFEKSELVTVTMLVQPEIFTTR